MERFANVASTTWYQVPECYGLDACTVEVWECYVHKQCINKSPTKTRDEICRQSEDKLKEQ